MRDEIAKVMGFWMALGISGFRVDAVPFLLETSGASAKGADEFADPHDYLRALRAFLGRRSGDGILLGEVNLPYEEQAIFFGGDKGAELTMQFDFLGMQHLYLALARADATPLARTLAARPKIDPDCQWASFVRNHDELTLDKLTDAERQEVFAAFGPEEAMQIYGRGLKRRLPPMLDGDQRRIRMIYSLMFSLPGTPVLFYGEEIGMGENLEADGRQAVRTPMQWSADKRNGGFSTAAPSRLPNPVVEGAFSPTHVNVANQRRDPASLLGFMTLLVQRYRECPELGWGDLELLEQPHAAVLAHCSRWDGSAMVAVHNLGPEALTVPLQIAGCDDTHRLVDLLADGSTSLDARGRTSVELDGYGYRWLRLVGPDDTRLV